MKMFRVLRRVPILCVLSFLIISTQTSISAYALPNDAPLRYLAPTGTGFFVYVPEYWQDPIFYNGVQTYVAYQRGYEASFTAPEPTIILDFGRQLLADSGNWAVVLIPSGVKHSMTWTRNIAQAFIDGYNANAAHPHAYIAIGTNNGNYPWLCNNNDATQVSSLWSVAGNVWGSFIVSLIPRTRVTIKSANDIEAWYAPSTFGSWTACGVGTLGWFSGYESQTTIANYDFGNNPNSEYSPQWTVHETWQVAWGRPPAYNMPEIYCTGSGWAQSWVTIMQYRPMSFLGVTSTDGQPAPCGTGLTWQQSWYTLNKALEDAGYYDAVISNAVRFKSNP